MKNTKQYSVEVKTIIETGKFHTYAKVFYSAETPKIAAEKALHWCCRFDKTIPYYIDSTTIFRVKQSHTPFRQGVTFFKLADLNTSTNRPTK